MRGSQALTMPGTHSKLDQQQQQQQQNLPEHANHHSGAAAAAGSSTPTSEGWVQGSGLAHARVQGWDSPGHSEVQGSGLGHARVQGWGGWGSSAASRYWAGQGLPEMSHKDDKDMICAKW
jgi:hypothetical protein